MEQYTTIPLFNNALVELTDEKDIKFFNKTLDMLDDDVVQNVYHNWDEPGEDEE